MNDRPLSNTQKAVIMALWDLKLDSAAIAFVMAIGEPQVAAEISRIVTARKFSATAF